MLPKNRKINVDAGHIQSVMKDHIREFAECGWLQCWDSNLSLPEHFDTAKLRCLFIFVSTGESRAVSATDGVLNNIIKHKYEDEIFVDLAYMPLKENLPLYEKYELPVLVSSIAQRAPHDYDVIFISNSTVEEKINIPWLLYHSAIPEWFAGEGGRQFDESIPPIILGGNSCDLSDMLLGESPDGKNRSIVDMIFHGFAENVLDRLIDDGIWFREEKAKGTATKEDFYARLIKKYDCFQHALAYDYVWGDPEKGECNWHIKEVLKTRDDTPDEIMFNRPEDIDSFAGFERKILHPVVGGNHRSADLQISQGCSSGAACTFCKEAYVSGGWREKSIGKMEQEILQVRSWSVADNVSYYSFNSNYYSQYLKIIGLAVENFPTMAFISMRADVIGARPDYFDVNKRIGMKRTTLGIEGCSERIRNGYLNKNLNYAHYLSAVRAAFVNRFLEIKLFCINTGIESRADFDDFLSMVDDTLRLRDELGANTSIRVSFTHLTFYPDTPLQWEPRRSMAEMLAGKKRYGYLIEQLKKRGCRFRFSSKGTQSIYPQLMLDLGQKFTPIMYRAAMERDVLYFRNIPVADIAWMVEQCEDAGHMMSDLVRQRPLDFIFPMPYVYTVNEAYLKRMYKKCVIEMKEIQMCLATPAHPDSRLCRDCGYCDTQDEIARRTQRNFDTTTTIDDVLVKASRNKPHFKTIFKMSRNPALSHLDPISTWRYTLAAILRNMGIPTVKKLFSAGETMSKFCNRENVIDMTYGTFLAEVTWKEPVDIEAIKRSWEEVKPRCKSMDLVSIKEVPMEFKLKREDWQLVLINSKHQDLSLREKIKSWDKTVKVIEKSMGTRDPEFSQVHMPNLMTPLFYEGGAQSGSFIIAAVPAYVNPFALISSITGEKFERCLPKYEVNRLFYFREGQGMCRVSGQKTFLDLSSLQEAKYSVEVYAKSILKKIMTSGNIRVVTDIRKAEMIQGPGVSAPVYLDPNSGFGSLQSDALSYVEVPEAEPAH